jgi:hypothetical protein
LLLLERMKKTASGTSVTFDALHVAEIIDTALIKLNGCAGNCCEIWTRHEAAMALYENLETVKKLCDRVQALEVELRQSPHDAECHPSEDRHSERCRRVRALLNAGE